MLDAALEVRCSSPRPAAATSRETVSQHQLLELPLALNRHSSQSDSVPPTATLGLPQSQNGNASTRRGRCAFRALCTENYAGSNRRANQASTEETGELLRCTNTHERMHCASGLPRSASSGYQWKTLTEICVAAHSLTWQRSSTKFNEVSESEVQLVERLTAPRSACTVALHPG